MTTYIYNYSPKTSEFTRRTEARENPLSPGDYLLPAFATFESTPDTNENSVAVRSGGADGEWIVMADYRGVEYTDQEGNTVVIEAIGERVPDYSSAEYEAGVKLAKYKSKVTELLTIKSNRNNVYPFMYEGNQYKNDEINIFGVKIAAYGKADTDPLQTFIGTDNEGCWKTDDRQYIPFTYQEFMDGVFETYFLMRSANFTNADVLYHQLEAIYLDTETTSEDIEAFDLSVGWSEITVVPE